GRRRGTARQVHHHGLRDGRSRRCRVLRERRPSGAASRSPRRHRRSPPRWGPRARHRRATDLRSCPRATRRRIVDRALHGRRDRVSSRGRSLRLRPPRRGARSLRGARRARDRGRGRPGSAQLRRRRSSRRLRGRRHQEDRVKLERRAASPLLIGHRGAKGVARENTREALQAAVEAGVDAVELDVSPGLLVAHALEDAHEGTLTLDEALAFLGAHEVGVHLDVKLSGYEQAVLETVDRHGLRGRTYVSTAFASVARRVADLAPDLTVAIGYPRDRYGVSRFPWPEPLTRAGAAALRQAMPARIPLLLKLAHANALALHH